MPGHKTKTYMVVSSITISVSTSVEAHTLKEALQKAGDRAVMSLCHQCAGSEGSVREWVTSGELDGHPSSSTISGVLVDGEPISLTQLRKARRMWREG